MNTENENTLKLRLFEDNGESLYLVAWRGTVCELLCCYNPAHNGAEEVARDMRGLLDGSIKPADFEEGEWVDELLEECETEAERATVRRVAFEGLRGLARVWTDGRWADWADLADWTREVRLWYTTIPQELPTVDLCVEFAETVQFREGYSAEQTHVETMELLHRAIELMDWSLDTAVLNCEKLDTLARHDYAEIWAMFEDSEQGGPLPREKADMFCIHVGGLNLCGAEYGTKYNDDGAVVLGWIVEALKLPPAAHQEYQDGWYEDEWKLSEIAKGDAK